MKKYLLICLIIISLFLSLPTLALAQGSNLEDGLILFEDNTILPTANIEAVIAKLINAALTLSGLVLVGIFLYGGTVWMLALGDETKVQQAKSAMLQGVIGLLVIVMSYSIANWILNALSSATGSSL